MQIVDCAPPSSRPAQQAVRLTASEHQALVRIRQAAQKCCNVNANDRLGRTLAEKHGVFVTIRTGLPQGFHGLSHSYLLVQLNPNGPAIVVDGQFKDRFQYGALTGGSYAACVAALPDLFVGTIQAVASLVNILSDALQREAIAKGHELPPWRSKKALFTNWLPARFTDQVILPPGSRSVHPVLLRTSHNAPAHLRVLEQCRQACGDCTLPIAPLEHHPIANGADAVAQAPPTAACPSLVRQRKNRPNAVAPYTAVVQRSSACDAADGPVDGAPSRLIIRGFSASDGSSTCGNSRGGDVTSAGCFRDTQVMEAVKEDAPAPTTCRTAIGNAQAATNADPSVASTGDYCGGGSGVSGCPRECCFLQRVFTNCRPVEEELSKVTCGAVRCRTPGPAAAPDSPANTSSCRCLARGALSAARTKRVSSLTLDLAAAGVVRHQLAQGEQGSQPSARQRAKAPDEQPAEAPAEQPPEQPAEAPAEQPAKLPSGQRAQPGSMLEDHQKQPQQGQQERQKVQQQGQAGQEPRALVAGRRPETAAWEPTAVTAAAVPAAPPTYCAVAPGRDAGTAPAMANEVRPGARVCMPASVQPPPACRHGEGQELLRGTLLVAERPGTPGEQAPKRLLARVVPATTAASADSSALPYTGPALPCAIVPCTNYDAMPRIITIRPVGPLRGIKA